jgi:hypothetical protein
VDYEAGAEVPAFDVPPGTPDSLGVPDAPGVPATPGASEPGPGQAKGVTTTSGLYLRKLPGKDGARIKEMPIGTIVSVLQVEGGWARVRYLAGDGTPHVGWCCTGEGETEYLRFGEG